MMNRIFTSIHTDSSDINENTERSQLTTSLPRPTSTILSSLKLKLSCSCCNHNHTYQFNEAERNLPNALKNVKKRRLIETSDASSSPLVMSTLAFLKEQFYQGERVSDESFKALHDAFDLLMQLNDELILLLLENIVIDVVFNELTMGMNSYPFGASSHGAFYPGVNRVRISHLEKEFSPIENILMATIIHEFTHAVSHYSFDGEPANGFSMFTPKRNPRSLPFPGVDPLSPHAFINPPKLKLLHAMRSVAEISIFPIRAPFNTKNLKYLLVGLKLQCDNKDLTEVLAYYMGLRVEWLKVAKANNIPQKTALESLNHTVPFLQSYCETDFKKVLRARAEHYAEQVKNYFKDLNIQMESDYFNRFDYQQHGRVTTHYKNSGCLQMRK